MNTSLKALVWASLCLGASAYAGEEAIRKALEDCKPAPEKYARTLEAMQAATSKLEAANAAMAGAAATRGAALDEAVRNLVEAEEAADLARKDLAL